MSAFGLPGRWIKNWIRKHRSFAEVQLKVWERQNPFLGTPLATEFAVDSQHVVGIAEDWAQGHVDFLKACQDLGVGYKVVDILADDWVEQLRSAEIEILFVRPVTYTSLWKQIFDERMHFIANELKIMTSPSIGECWLYESKRRIRDWLALHNIPAPETKVFLREDHALEELSRAKLPIVMKTDTGAAASGVSIVRSRAQGARLIKQIFRKGVQVNRSVPQDIQWGCVLFQEYLPNCREWRMVRIGDSCFCREKVAGADGLHSGSGSVRWAKPSLELLNRLWEVTDAGNFTSMNVDFFEAQDGRLLVNELHAYFGGIRPENIDKGGEWKGRWRRSAAGEWSFESGYFYQNACANLRVKMMLGLGAEGGIRQ